MDVLEHMAETLKLLADKTRLKILALLKERELCVCEIVELMEATQPNVSQHLRKLKAAGLVRESRRGQWVYYSLAEADKPYVQAIMNDMPSLKERLAKLNLACDDMECCN